MASLGAAAILLLLILWTGAGQTASETVTACHMGGGVTKEHPFLATNGTFVFAVGYVDWNGNLSLDPDEPIYYDAEPNESTGHGMVSAADVRLSDIPEGPQAGTHPSETDEDAGQRLRPLDSVNLTFIDADGDQAHDLGEHVLIDVDGSNDLSVNDRFLAPDEYAGTTAASSSDMATAKTALQPFFGFILWIDADGDPGPAGRILFADRDYNGALSENDLCLSDHVVSPPPETSPSPTKTTEESPTLSDPRTISPSPSPDAMSPSPSAEPTTDQQPGGFERDGGRFEGRYVALTVDLAEGVVTEFTVEGVSFVDQVLLACPCSAEVHRDANGRPTALRVQSDETFLLVNDQPSGLMAFAAFGEVPLDFRLDPSVTFTRPDDTTVRLERDGRVAWITAQEFGRDVPSGLETFSGADGTHVLIRGPGVHFVSNPTSAEPFFQTNQQTVEEAILERRLAVQVQVLRTERGNEPQLLAYEDVRSFQVRQPAELEYEIEIDAEFTEPRAFLFQFPRETLPAEKVEVRYFHQESADAPVESRVLVEGVSLQDVLDPEPGEPAKFYVEATPSGFQVAAAVPEFSIQLFQVLGIPPETAPIFAYGVVLVFLFLGVGVMGVLVGRKGRPVWKPKRRELVPWAGL